MTSPPNSVLVRRYHPLPTNTIRTKTTPSTSTSSYRTRSQSRSSLTISTRSMSRSAVNSALGEMTRNGSGSLGEGMGRNVGGGKRKPDESNEDQDQRKPKASRLTNENKPGEENNPGGRISGGSSRKTGTSSSVATTTSPPTTPVRAIQPTQVPTPAREILKAGYECTGERTPGGGAKYASVIPSFILKPPTPPRSSHQYPKTRLRVIEEVPVIPGNAKRSRSPDELDEAPSKRIGIATTNDPSVGQVGVQANQIVNGNEQSDHTMSYSTRILGSPAQLTSASVGTPRRALESISRFGTPKKVSASASDVEAAQTANPPPTPVMPMLCTQFSSTTPPSTAVQTDITGPQPSQTSLESAGDVHSTDDTNDMQVDHEKESRPVKSLPKLSSMGPPSRLPVMTSKPPLAPSAAAGATGPSAISTSSAGLPKLKAKPKPQLGVAQYRPRRRTVAGPSSVKVKPLVVFDENSNGSGSGSGNDGGGGGSKPEAPIRRKPSYPSTLGSGPLANPRPRLISGPFQPPRSFSSSAAPPSGSTSSSSQEDVEMGRDPVKQTIRSVSDPSGRPRASLSSRRESLMSDTSRSLAEMSEALAKLKVRREDQTDRQSQPLRPLNTVRPKVPSVLGEVTPSDQTTNINTIQPVATSSRLSSVHRPRSSVAIAGADVTMDDGDRSMAVLMSTDKGENALRGVVAFVDVRTEDGGCAGDIWADMLRSLGAKVSPAYPTLFQTKLESEC